MSQDLQQRAERARAWLFEAALPVWAEHGVNPRGGFYDRLGPDLAPSGPGLMRLRVQARQTYVFAEAGRLGWRGPWRPLVEHGLVFLLHRATLDDGLVGPCFEQDGGLADRTPELYDQAFALFALAQAYRALGEEPARGAAVRLRQALQADAHPLGGYRERSRSGLGANANMHLFEAALAWEEVDGGGGWSQMADGLANLCATRLTDAGGVVREHFDDEWRPEAGPRGEITEPGHHFEWAWLMARSGRGDPSFSARLCARAEREGVDPVRGVALNEVDAAGRPLDVNARLWPQTERLRAALLGSAASADSAAQAFDALFAYIDPAPAGLWYDVMDPEGRVKAEPAPASSLYHIVGALSELIRQFGTP